MTIGTPIAIAVLLAELVPAAAFGFAPERAVDAVSRWTSTTRLIVPVVFVLPYATLAASQHIFRWSWFALYAALPVVMTWLLQQAARVDPQQRGNWRDGLILLTLGLA